MLFLLSLCISVAVSASVSHALQPLSEELIRYVNEESGAHWIAEKSSRFRTMEDIRSHLGTNFEPAHLKRSRRPTVHHHIEVELPKSFDAREHWPNCTTIGKIRDQSGCGSCWAFGATEAMSDRICIASGGKTNVDLSSRHLLSCCHKCGFGCQGGMLGPAWDYWMRSGLVTGSSMEEGEGCQPYPFPMCTHHGYGTRPPCPEKTYATPGCKHTCQKQYNKTYLDDKHYGRSSYNIPCDEKQIMKEIMTNGPVEAAFTVYDDFMNYKSGVYHHVTGGLLGGHAIKILGWGVEGKTPYWLVANSWNEEWGENGFFRIRRGNNECGIEDEVIAGLAKH